VGISLALITVNQRAILSRLGVETASNSFHLSMSPSSILAGGFWSDLYGHDLRNTPALSSTKANDDIHGIESLSI
jgi:hypothetical protein